MPDAARPSPACWRKELPGPVLGHIAARRRPLRDAVLALGHPRPRRGTTLPPVDNRAAALSAPTREKTGPGCSRTLGRTVPVLDWGAAATTRERCQNDLDGGVIVTIMLIPQSLSLRVLAGLPPEAGLYAFDPAYHSSTLKSSAEPRGRWRWGRWRGCRCMTAARRGAGGPRRARRAIAIAAPDACGDVGAILLAIGLLKLGSCQFPQANSGGSRASSTASGMPDRGQPDLKHHPWHPGGGHSLARDRVVASSRIWAR